MRRVGTPALHSPRIRDGRFSTDLFAQYQRSEQAFVFIEFIDSVF
ncbi:transposase [Paenibacillus alvei]|nr:transposase [Paenibacillus alvei]MCY9543118.1 transposase [Paenibacillus alvei]MCY9707893.1 transposase [Paenibacillus alvei]MEC0079816.1 transposase [Paenibacillus alvei]